MMQIRCKGLGCPCSRPGVRRDRIVVIESYTPIIHTEKRMVNILSPVYRYKKYRFVKPPTTGSAKAEPAKVIQPPLSMTLLAPKPVWYVVAPDPLFEVPMGLPPKACKSARKRRHSEMEQSNSYDSTLIQILAEGLKARAGKNFTRRMQAVVPNHGVSSLQYASLVYMKLPFGLTTPVPNSKCVTRVVAAPPPNPLTSFLPARARKPADDGFKFAFVWADGQTWKLRNMKNSEKPRYKFCTKQAVRFRIGKRLPAIAEKNEDERFLQVEDWTQKVLEGQRLRYLDEMKWEQLQPEGDAKILEGTRKPGRSTRLPQCPFHTRLYCSSRHTWLLRDFRSCPLCPNTYTAL